MESNSWINRLVINTAWWYQPTGNTQHHTALPNVDWYWQSLMRFILAYLRRRRYWSWSRMWWCKQSISAEIPRWGRSQSWHRPWTQLHPAHQRSKEDKFRIKVNALWEQIMPTWIGGLRMKAIKMVMTNKNMKYFMNQESHCSQLLIPIILIASCQ